MGLFRRRRRNGWVAVLVAVFVVIAAVLAYGYAETYRIEVEQYTFVDPDVPAVFDGTRIAFLTDIHRGPFLSQDRVRSLVERVNALEPDMVLLGGDYVYADTDYAASCFAELRNLEAPLGVFAVLGNHDYEEHDDGTYDPSRVIQAIDQAGIALLQDGGVWIDERGERIRVGGVSDLNKGRPRVRSVLEGTTEADLVLLVSHNPDYSERIPEDAVDLVLSGHTHGGQISFFGLWAPYVPSDFGQKYRTGVVVNDVTTVIVSNGIGTSTIPPIRLLTRPQIVVITLESGGDAGADAAGGVVEPGAAGPGLVRATVARLDVLS